MKANGKVRYPSASLNYLRNKSKRWDGMKKKKGWLKTSLLTI